MHACVFGEGTGALLLPHALVDDSIDELQALVLSMEIVVFVINLCIVNIKVTLVLNCKL